MQPNGHTWMHWAHPMHWAGSMVACPSSSLPMAGQPMRTHLPQARQSSTTATPSLDRSTRRQGLRKTRTESLSADLVGPEREAQRLYIEPLAPLDGERVCSAYLLMQGDAVTGIALAAGHGRRAVVEYAERARSGIVDGAEHARDARMGKGAIADHSDDRSPVAHGNVREFESVRDGQGRAHVDRGMHGVQRSRCAERVAADITAHDCLHVAQHGEDEAMRAPRA